jgi:hypothetical protein
VLHGIVLGTEQQREDIRLELLRVLSYETPADSHFERTSIKLCSEAGFLVPGVPRETN